MYMAAYQGMATERTISRPLMNSRSSSLFHLPVAKMYAPAHSAGSAKPAGPLPIVDTAAKNQATKKNRRLNRRSPWFKKSKRPVTTIQITACTAGCMSLFAGRVCAQSGLPGSPQLIAEPEKNESAWGRKPHGPPTISSTLRENR